MNQLWNQLRPGERRWVVFIGCIVFVVLNYFFVWPQFKQWRVNGKRMADAQAAIDKDAPEIRRGPEYEKALKNFDSEGTIPASDQILNFATFYQSRAVENGIRIQSESPRPPHTNDFSIDLQTTLDVSGDDKKLVGFLYSLGSSASQVRVREMNLHAVEPNRYELHASLTIVASYSYQKKPSSPAAAAKSAASTSAAPAPASAPHPNGMTISTIYATNKLPGMPGGPGVRPNINPLSATNKPGMPKH